MQEKKCRKCKKYLDIIVFPKMNIGKYGVGSTCIRCLTENTKNYEIKRTKTTINKVSKTNNNTPAKFEQKTKDEIKKRQKGKCILTGDPIEEYHHAYFGPLHANYGESRNNADQGVGLSAKAHRIIHHASPKESHQAKIYRAKCIIYLKNYYAL